MYQARLTAQWGVGEAQRDAGLRARVGGLLVVGGSAGVQSALEPLGWQADYTRTARLGPAASAGFALPFGDAPSDPLLDLRVGASMAFPVSAGGGALAGQDRDLVLTVENQSFGSAGAARARDPPGGRGHPVAGLRDAQLRDRA